MQRTVELQRLSEESYIIETTYVNGCFEDKWDTRNVLIPTDYTGRWKIETKYKTSQFGEYIETLLFLECFDIIEDRVCESVTIG